MLIIMVTAAIMNPAALAAAAGRFAGQPVAVDMRLAVPDCAAPLFEMAGERVEVRCEAPAWRVFLPFRTDDTPLVKPGVVRQAMQDAGPQAPRTIKRGERVVVLVEGAGFTVSMDAVADADARDGRLWVKAANGEGRRMLARIREDGNVVIEG